MDKLYSNIGDISENHYNYLMNLENVNGVGYGSKYINNKNTFEPCIHVLVEKKKDNKYLTKNNRIPKNYMGIKTDVIEVGKFIKYSDESDLSGEYFKDRPLQGGSSIGVLGKIRHGTLCCIVRKLKKIKKSKEYEYIYYILSNNHVLANLNKNPIGTIIVQPVSKYTHDSVAVLEKFIPIKFYNKFNMFSYNTVDCAIARILDKSFISNRVVGFGKIKGVTDVVDNMKIKKYGATTKITLGRVISVNTTTIVKTYDDKKKILYKKQIIANLLTESGDSGSPILTEYDNKLIGIFHSGNDEGVAIISDINLVLKKLKVEVYIDE